MLVFWSELPLALHFSDLDYDNKGVFSWVDDFINMILDASSDTVDYQLQQLLPDQDPKQYYRFQPLISKDNKKMDNPKKKNLEELVRSTN